MRALLWRWLALEVAALCGPDQSDGKVLRCTWPNDHMPHAWHADFPGVYGDWWCNGLGPASPLIGGNMPARLCQSAVALLTESDVSREPHQAHSWTEEMVGVRYAKWWCKGVERKMANH